MTGNASPRPDDTIRINSELAQRVWDELGENVYLCYQCVKCSSGCPLTAFFDWQPNQIMRAVQLGQEDIALESSTPWLCANCQTCSTRCPQGLDITAIMEFLTREALERNIEPAVPEVDFFNRAFMREVRWWGRAYELGLMIEMKLRTMNLLDDMDLALKFIPKNKLAFLPSPTRTPRHVKPVPGAAQTIAYYPGCSLHSTAREFDTSTRAVCEALGMTLVEPKGWVCCGSSAAHRIDPEAALRLPMANLSVIEQTGFTEVTMPCAACFNRHKAAQHEIRHDAARKQAVDAAAGYVYQDRVQVTTLIQAIHNHVGADEVAQNVANPLKELNVVSYYGCLLTRPPGVTEAPNPENPTDMDELVAALGATAVDWSYKTQCCGASLTLSKKELAHAMSAALIEEAQAAGADVMVVACPLCHLNLDGRQFQMGLDEPLPVLYITQLMALALGLPETQAALGKNIVDPHPVLRQHGVIQG